MKSNQTSYSHYEFFFSKIAGYPVFVIFFRFCNLFYIHNLEKSMHLLLFSINFNLKVVFENILKLSTFLLFAAFKVIEGTHAFGQKFVFFLGQIVNIALALYKCQSMGLLPTHASDWLAFVEPQARIEYSGGGLIYV